MLIMIFGLAKSVTMALPVSIMVVTTTLKTFTMLNFMFTLIITTFITALLSIVWNKLMLIPAILYKVDGFNTSIISMAELGPISRMA